jgi:hypothetical protein
MILKSGKSLPLVVLKTSNEVINDSSVFQDDDELFITLPKNKLFKVKFYLSIIAAGGAEAYDIKFKLTTTGTLGAPTTSSRVMITCMGGNSTNPPTEADLVKVATYAIGDSMISGISNTRGFAMIDLLVATGASGGILTLQWCQNAPGAVDTYVNEGSYLEAMEVKSVS